MFLSVKGNGQPGQEKEHRTPLSERKENVAESGVNGRAIKFF
jgi:hypothetical protein